MKTIKDQIKKHALSYPNEEVCGFVIKDLVIPSKNIAENTNKNVRIDPIDYLNTFELGNIDFVYHSHTSDTFRFTNVDKKTFENFNLKGIVYFNKINKFKIYIPGQEFDNKYVNRQFLMGKNDCFSLVRDFYQNELGILIQNYSYDEKWFDQNPSILLDNYENEGFVKVNDLQKNDVVLVKYLGRCPQHILIYLGDNLILHQPRFKHSLVEFYSEELKRRSFCILRHKKCFN